MKSDFPVEIENDPNFRSENRMDRLSGRNFLVTLLADCVALAVLLALGWVALWAVGWIVTSQTGTYIFIVGFLLTMYRIAYLTSKGKQ